jgi:hypothetical protein
MMATNKPRITVTLTQQQYNVIKSISDSGGSSMSGMVSEFIESAMPVFYRMASTFQRLKKLSDDERGIMRESLHEAQSTFEPIAAEILKQWDLFSGPMDENNVTGDVLKMQSILSTASESKTPLTNRGVTPQNKTLPRASIGNGLKPILKKEVLKKSAQKIGVKNNEI